MILHVVRVPCGLLILAGDSQRFGHLVEWEQSIPRPVCVVHTAPVIDGAGVGARVDFAYVQYRISTCVIVENDCSSTDH